MSEISVRLQKALDDKNWKASDLSKATGINKSSISSWLGGEYNPKQDKIYNMAKVLNVDPAWLAGFDTKMKNNADYSINKPTNMIEVGNTINIPILGRIACGDPITAEENIEEYKPTFTDGLPSGELFYLRAEGDSMTPVITDESLVLCRAQPDVENGEIAAVLVNGDEEATLKKVRKLDGYILLEAINEEYSPYLVNESNPAKIVGKAVEVVNKL